MKKFDFSGWATRANIKCSDGRTIMKDAFKANDGKTVPMVWNHEHNDPLNVLGHALLESRDGDMYAYCSFNDTESGKAAKTIVEHGDVTSLSIYANHLKHNGANVLDGVIREVSIVLAGANPGAFIDSVMSHGEALEDEATIYTGEEISLFHADEPADEKDTKDDGDKKSEEDETVADVFNTLTDKQKNVVYAIAGQIVEENGDPSKNNKDLEGGDKSMKHNVFDQDEKKDKDEVLSHSEMMEIFKDGPRYGSLRESALQHGITNIDYLFPDAKNVTNVPTMITRKMGWVQNVMSGVHKTPFSRIKSLFANITEEDARAKGYIKGHLKKDEVFSLLKRVTTPTTVYKKQKLDRDDLVDITDFEVIAWLKAEMRMMLDEEFARAYLIGDGRLASSEDKINELNIRPIWKDEDLYTIKKSIDVTSSTTADQKAAALIRLAIKARKEYKGSGDPSLFTTEDFLTDCLLLEDKMGRLLYESEARLATVLRVKEIVTVPVMEGVTRVDGTNTLTLQGIIVNLDDYNVGADKGGAVNMFDDFDIDYNQQKYLIESRCSGALIKPYSAIVLETKAPTAG